MEKEPAGCVGTSDTADHMPQEPIAIIGMGCRFPGPDGQAVTTPDAFWDLLCSGEDIARPVPASRWDVDAVYDPTPETPGKIYVREGYWLEDVDRFDAEFFQLAAREAAAMDPQQRLLLEVSWEALESAALPPTSLAGSQTGIYLSSFWDDYSAQRLYTGSGQQIGRYALLSSMRAMASGRLAHLLGVHGPNLLVDTACAASLTAIHLACQALRAGECDLALAGGAYLLFGPENMLGWCQMGALSADGRSKTFDQRADGFGMGEGAGVVVLKGLAAAKAAGDPILAVIRGSALNHGGHSRTVTTPNGQAQRALLRQALRQAGVDPHAIQYVEAHGTGTRQGDPIEVGALDEVLGVGRAAAGVAPLLIGSVKSNIGHLNAAAGMAGLCKVVMALQHAAVPPTLHITQLNPRIPWEQLGVTVPTAMTPWPESAEPRMAGVSAFGISGSNAHVVLEAAPETPLEARTDDHPLHLLPIAARDAAALDAYVQAYISYLDAHPHVNLGDLCSTAQVGRNPFAHRLSVVAGSVTELRTRLGEVAAGQTDADVRRGSVAAQQPAPKVAFLFTGHGGQYAGMGLDLDATEPTFHAALDECAELLVGNLDRPLREVLTDEEALERLTYQPALFAVEYALARLWQSWGVEPEVLIGHSMGELVAACLAGVFSLEDGLKLVAARGRLMGALPPDGAMVAIAADEARVREAIAPYVDDVAIAAVNGPMSVVISGRADVALDIAATFAAEGIKTQRLKISHASHSPLIEPMLEAFRAVAATVVYHAPTRCLVSNVTGTLAGEEIATADYWVRHVRETVRFADGAQTLHSQGVDVFLEIGPRPVLLGMIGDILSPASALSPQPSALLPSLRPGQEAWQTLLSSLGAMYVRGAVVNWAGLHRDVVRRKISLPTYPFQRQRYWVEAPTVRHRDAVRPLVDQVIHLPARGETICETTFSVAALPFLAEHRVYGEVVSPGACQLVLALSAAELTLGTAEGLTLHDVILPQALVLPEGQARMVQVVLSPVPEPGGTTRAFAITSFAADAAGEASAVATHATGQVTTQQAAVFAGDDLAVLQQRCRVPLALAVGEDGPLSFGPTFRWIAEAWQSADPATPEVLARLVLPTAVPTLEGYPLHPGLLDACFQVALLQAPQDQGALLPFAIAALDWRAPATGGIWWCHARPSGPLTWDVYLRDEAGALLVALTGFQLRVAPASAIQGTSAWQDWLYTVAWQSRAIFGMPPTYLPTPVQALPPRESTGPDPAAETLRTALDTFSVSAVLNAFATAGVVLHVGTRWTLMQLIQQLGVIPSYRRLLRRLVGILAEAGVVAPEGEGWRVAQAWPLDFADACATFAVTTGDAPEARLLARCGRRLGEALRGVQEPLELLFPAGDTSDAERLYRETPTAQILNGLVQTVVGSACERLPTERGLRVLEIGAGTGGTTAGILPLLPVGQSEYTFTDSGPSFLRQAEVRFAAYPFVHYQTLDIERSPLSQNFASAQADLVIAANVLHATRSLAETLGHVRNLLAPGGQLVLREATTRECWVDLTFGLTEGWWRFADERADHPLIPAATWESLLLAHGFASVAVTEYAGQAVIVAQADQVWPVVAARDWLIFADRQGVGAALAVRLRERGDQVWEVYADAPGFVPEGTEAQTIDPDAAEAYQQVVGISPHWYGVVHLWSLDMPEVPQDAAADAPDLDLVDANRQGCGAALLLTQALLARQDGLAGLWLVTQDSQAVAAGDAVTGVVQAGLWGMGKVIDLEHPELRPVCVDLSAGTDRVTALVALLSATGGPEARESQIALRTQGQYVARLQRTKEASPAQAEPIPDGPYHLEIVEPGFLERLALVPLTRRDPAAGEVEIQVEASGLNFRDVMESLDLFPFAPMALGKECAGRITQVGPGVTEEWGLTVGDRVVACVRGGFSQYVIADAALVAPIPATLSATEAAGIPINFLTAHYALHTVTHIQPGETVLIHAAAGGTGMAAVQIAQAAGAVVYATASPHKWPALRAMGVQHLYHSRTLDFGPQILRDTGGRGVDMVLNSLTSAGFIATSIGLLAPAGRFVELAQRNIWSPAEVSTLRPDVGYTVLELLDEIQLHPQQVGALLQQVMHQFATGTLRPLPMQVYPVTQAVAAFRMMQHARHVGKIVLTLAAVPDETAVAPTIRPDATYLITGGLGGLGLAVADWLVAAGARHLLLMGRRAPDAAAQARLDAMHAHGAVVQVAQADVTDAGQLRVALQQIPADAPLAGIIHGVGVLADGALLNQDWSRFSRVLAPKVQGAWQLHLLTQGMPLDFMVFFSSVASLIGSAGQSNHAAANAFLDALAAYRQVRGLPALSINWGRWAEIGAAAELVRAQQHQAGQEGMGAIAPAQGIAAFAHLLGWQVPQVGVVAIHWPAMREQGAAAIAFDAELRRAVVSSPVAATTAPRAVAQEIRSARGEARRSLLLTVLRTAVAGVLGVRDSTQLDPAQGLMAMGVDSLMAVELRNHLARDLQISLPSTLIFDHPTMTALCAYIETRINSEEPTAGADESVQMPALAQTLPAQADHDHWGTAQAEPIAIIGMACRFPGASDTPEQFWQLLAEGRDAVVPLPDNRRTSGGTPPSGGFLARVDGFDPTFFGIAPREAPFMDPQQRLALEVGWEALEHAGILPKQLAQQPVGVFIGACNNDYAMLTSQLLMDSAQNELYQLTGRMQGALAGRISYTLGFTGPAVVVDTACSSSLVALHQACQSLRAQECHLALAGGVNLILTETWADQGSSADARLHAPDGRCKSFDASANGFGRGEGCGIVVLKRLSQAQADGDTILGMIRGAMVNQDGRSSGFSAPNGPAQETVVRQALSHAGCTPDEVSYIEAHGTGTTLGDPIEIGALTAVFGERATPLWVGSAKSNLAHLEAAAGIAGVIKVLLAFQHGQIPPNIHFRHPNPYINWADAPVQVPVSAIPWPTDRRIAGVSSFGISGTNAHIVLEAAPEAAIVPREETRPAHLLPIAAKDVAARDAYVQAYIAYLDAHPDVNLGDLCSTAQVGRSPFAHRLSVVAGSVDDLRAQLVAGGGQIGMVAAQQPAPKIAFLFTGQGSQYAGMGLALDATEPTFREALDACAAILDPLLGRPLREILNDPAVIDQTTYTQPALFALEYALAQMWQAWGIAPDILIGHSVGELVAACIAGVFSLEDGLRLVAARGRLMGELPPDGAMVAIAADEARVHTAIAPYAEDVSIAAVNGPTSVVISGRTAAVRAIAAQCVAEGLRSQSLTVSHAFHSPLMEPMLDDFRAVAETITYHAPTRRLVSNLTGTLAGDEVTTPEYWVRHVREAVRFADGVTTLHAQGTEVFLEIGPKPVLLGMVGQGPGVGGQGFALLPSIRAGQDAWQTLLTSLGTMYVRGAMVNWAGLHRDVVRRRVALPTYPFQRQRYWVDAPELTGYGAVGLADRTVAELTAQIAQHGGFTTDEQALVARAFTALKAVQHADVLDARAAACTYTLHWQPAPAPARSSAVPGSWLIITDTGGVGAALATQLRDQGEIVTLVPAAAVADAIPLLASPDAPWRGVIYLGGLDAEMPDDAAALLRAQEQSLHPLLQLVAPLVALATARPRLWVVTQGAQTVTAGDLRAPAQAPLWGLGRVIAREHGDCWGGLIDLDPTDTLTTAATALLSEMLAAAPTDEPQVAYRQGQRSVARLVRSATPLAVPPAIVPQATYLITGGLGGLGLAVAEWLVAQGATHLVLTGRRGVTDERQRVALDHLMSRGVAVRVESLDVTDESALARLLDDLATGDAPLRGIVHAAGVLDDGILLNQTWARFAPVLAPKVAGAWLIHHLTRDMKLDLLVFFSSVSAVLGSPGQGTYAAANAFLDGLASYRQQQGLPAVSINWGAWAEAGMAARTAALRSEGMTPLPVELGVQALGRAMGTGGHLAVLDADWDHLQAQMGVSAPLLTELVTPTVVEHAVATPLREELEALPPRQRDERLRTEVAQVVARVLGMGEPPSPTTGLTDLGMDSLMALELRRSLERLAGEPLPVTVAFEYPTVAALATYLRDEILVLGTTPAPRELTVAPAPSMTAPLAVVSMACRFPGAATPEAFWRLLETGADQVQEVPATRWPVADYYDPQRPLPGKVYTRKGSFLEHVDQFEPGFFGIAPREAVGMDPQHRLLLEVSWEALERAGIAPATLSLSRTGVFIGIGEGEYGGLRTGQDLAAMDSHAATSGGHSIAAGRLAYTLGLQGPTLAVDTACSSSLVAIHLACQSLRMGECDLALAGGVSLLLSPISFVALAQMQALAPDGRCKTFDAAADGYGRGEGCGIVLLKRLADAERDGDTILAVVRGSAVNHDGPSSGLTVPNKQAQENLLRAALANAGVDAAAVGYVEAHGTGTPLGDPIELRALGAVFAERESPLAVGSVKTNIGHLEAAAGIAGVIKTVLALQHGVIPPHLHLREPNPHVEWATLSLVVPTVSTPWGGDGQPRIAGVSAFGFSGTNAHVVLEAAPEASDARRTEDRPLHLLPIAAKDAAARDAYVQSYVAYLDANPEVDVGDLCATAQMGRSPFAHRLSVVAGSVTELRAQLATGGGQQGVVTAQQPAPQVAFLFTGQSSQYAGMGLELDATEPTFREALDACATVLDPLLGRPLRDILNDPAVIDQTTYTQPALFALEYALAQMWQAWGVEPDILIGHSVGELVAACIAGVFSLEDGLKLVAARGRLMGELPPDGHMVAIAADEARVRDMIAPSAEDVSIAAVNGPMSVVISGRTARVRAIAVQCEAEGLRTHSLTVSHAFHSPLLEPMLTAFRAVAESITYHAPIQRLVSNLTGGLAEDDIATADYWVRHVREAVRFGDGVTTLHAHGVDVFLEIGPKPVLLGMIGERPTSALSPQPSALLPSLRPNQPAWHTLLTSLGALYMRGATANWAGLHRDVVRHKIALPTYPFQRQRYWVDAPPPQRADALRPLVDRMVRVARRGETIFEKMISIATLPFLADHQIYGMVVIPGAFHLAMALSGAGLLFDDAPCVVEDVIFPHALALAPDEARTVQMIVTAGRDGHPATFEVISLDEAAPDAAEVLHATGRVGRAAETVPMMDIAAMRARCPHALAPDDLYARIAATQVDLGPHFQWFAGIWTNGAGEALAQMRRPATLPEVRGYALFPSLLDACFQLVAAAEGWDAAEGVPVTRVPFALERLTWYQPGDHAELWCHVVPLSTEAGTRWNFTLCTPEGTVVATMQGLQLRAIPASAISGTRLRTDWLTTLDWQPQPIPTTQADRPTCWLLVGATDALAAELAQTAPVTSLPVTVDATILRQQVDALAAQHPSLGVVFWGDVGCRSIIPNDGHSERSEESRSGPFASLRVDMPDGATSKEGNTAAPAAALTACTALLHLSHAIIVTSCATRLWVVTSGTQDVAGYGARSGAAAAVGGSLWGFGRSLACEEPRLHTVLVDLDASQSPEAHARTLAAELMNGVGGEVAWRGETRFVAQMTPWRGRQAEAELRDLHPEASYLITGGLGALGLQIAEQLVADGARHLVLNSRRAAQTEAQQAVLARLAEAGATVEVILADVGDAAEVQRLLTHCATLGPLRGIVHAAGVLDDGVIAAQTPSRLAEVMRPKAEGIWHLHRLSAGLDLDFFVGFSSLASFMGSAGQSTYAAANGFVDGLMQLRQAQGLPGLSINWGPWAEVGMAAPLAEQFRRQGMGMISPAQGRAIFSHVVRHADGHVAVLPPIHAAPASLAQTPTLRADLGHLPDAERQPWLIHWLRREIARILLLAGPEVVDPQQPLFEMGMDSLMAIELRNRLSTNLNLPIHATLVFEYPTIESLAPWLLDQLRVSVDGATAAVAALPPPPSLAKPTLDAGEEDIMDATDAEILAFIDQEFGEVS